MSRYFSIIITYLIIGISTTFIQPLLPFIKNYLNLNNFQMMLFNTSFFISYFLFSYFSGKYIIRNFGIKYSLILGGILILIGSLFWIYSLKADNKNFLWFLFFTLIIGFGVVILFMVTQFNALFISGSKKTSNLTILQSAHAIGCFLTPLFITYFIYKDKNFNSLYFLKYVFIIFEILIILFLTFLSLSTFSKNVLKERNVKNRISYKIYFNWINLFIFVGLEISISTFFINHGLFYFDVSRDDAIFFLSLYWIFIVIGRILSGLIMRKMSEYKFFLINTIIGFLIVLFLIIEKKYFYLFFLSTLGLINAPIFPIIYSYGLSKNNFSSMNSSGIMASAICGGGVIPLLTNFLTNISINLSLLFILISYIYLIISTIFIKYFV